MLQLENNSHWQAALYPAWNAKRQPQITLVVKTSYWFDTRGEMTVMDHVPAIEEEDRHYGDPLTTSLAASCESVPFKQGGELLCYGTAQPPGDKATVMTVKLGLRRGEMNYWQKTLRVSGPRSWQRRLLSVVPGEPELLEPLPLRYESAYGGRDHRKETSCYEANPSGVGFSATSRHHADLQVPQIEVSQDYLDSLTQRPEPAGFGPLAMHWMPRLALSPKQDEEALGMGLCPFAEDLAPDFYNSAPKDQQFEAHFDGSETLMLQGLIPGADPEGVLIDLPGERPKVWLATSERQQSPLKMICDTVTIRADERELHLLWRCAIPTPIEPSGWVIVQPGKQDEERATDNNGKEHAA
ncbi:MAG: DUF2169 domain-containing protein [Candidatus Thiodiazotropha sp. (ex Monitilora ramsayi)]|nr:DUF2169 domain-containing protein [Candidatus Thiodiazotropha sp. (ex Monitilora ramsayi)]